MTSREWDFSLYFQDQWQVSRKLTAYYGLRWDYFPMGTRASRGMEAKSASASGRPISASMSCRAAALLGMNRIA